MSAGNQLLFNSIGSSVAANKQQINRESHLLESLEKKIHEYASNSLTDGSKEADSVSNPITKQIIHSEIANSSNFNKTGRVMRIDDLCSSEMNLEA